MTIWSPVMPGATTDDLPTPPRWLPDDASLFLDFDGTLVEIAERPDAVVVEAHLVSLLDRLASRLEGRLAIVSGRGASELATFLGAPGFLISGSHGAELRRANGRVDAPKPTPSIAAARVAIAEFAEGRPGLLVEEKPLGVALHFRNAPEAAASAEALARRIASDTGLVLQEGKMVFELRMAGSDKGRAIATLLSAPPFLGSRPVFIGDDVTDEAGFETVRALSGAGVLVGEPRETAASHRLGSVTAVLAWLEAVAR